MILGRFYLRQTPTGNLIGEFSNNSMNRNATESADLIDGFTNNFIGVYNSTWFEDSAQHLTLRIEAKANTNNMIFILRWSNPANVDVFFGEGFIIDNLLIGNYWDSEVQDRIGI